MRRPFRQWRLGHAGADRVGVDADAPVLDDAHVATEPFDLGQQPSCVSFRNCSGVIGSMGGYSPATTVALPAPAAKITRLRITDDFMSLPCRSVCLSGALAKRRVLDDIRMAHRKLFEQFGAGGFMRKLRLLTVSRFALRLAQCIEHQSPFDRRGLASAPADPRDREAASGPRHRGRPASRNCARYRCARSTSNESAALPPARKSVDDGSISVSASSFGPPVPARALRPVRVGLHASRVIRGSSPAPPRHSSAPACASPSSTYTVASSRYSSESLRACGGSRDHRSQAIARLGIWPRSRSMTAMERSMCAIRSAQPQMPCELPPRVPWHRPPRPDARHCARPWPGS